jgi:hypothetical protein
MLEHELCRLLNERGNLAQPGIVIAVTFGDLRDERNNPGELFVHEGMKGLPGICYEILATQLCEGGRLGKRLGIEPLELIYNAGRIEPAHPASLVQANIALAAIVDLNGIEETGAVRSLFDEIGYRSPCINFASINFGGSNLGSINMASIVMGHRASL